MFLPVLCYMVGSFATLTILTKNSLLENLGQDYVRTAFAKGLDERRVIFVHALRNSLIPIATGLGHVFSLILAGSFLIERVFNIDGMGYLGYTSILQRDYPVALGILVIGSLLMLVGQHPLRRHLRGGRPAHPVQMTDREPWTSLQRSAAETAVLRSANSDRASCPPVAGAIGIDLPAALQQVPPHQARLLVLPDHPGRRICSRSCCRS